MTTIGGDGDLQPPPPGVPIPANLPSHYQPKSSAKKGRNLLTWLIVFSSVIFVFVLLGTFLVALIPQKPLLPGKHIGVLELTGLIADSKDFIKELDDFLERGNISAIVIRIDSPGGVIAPSQEIFNAILKGRKEKKIFASMGTVAASGGYYIATAANTIVANPGTITGSIGVIMHLTNYEELQRWAKIKTYNVKSGKFKDMGSPTRMLTEEEQKIFQNIIDSMLNQFIDDIALGRGSKIEKEKIRELADGRIFTGKDAQELGLVDEVGGLQETIELAAKSVGIKGKPKVVYPKEKKEGFLAYLLENSLNRIIQGLLEKSLISENLSHSFQRLEPSAPFPYFLYLYSGPSTSGL